MFPPLSALGSTVTMTVSVLVAAANERVDLNWSFSALPP